MKKLISSILMTSIMAGSLCACSSKPAADDPVLEPTTKNSIVVTGDGPVDVNIKELSADQMSDHRKAYLNASFELLKSQFNNDQNVMISPASILLALSMTEAGASGNTRTQMAALWGGAEDPDAQLSYAAELLKRLNSSSGVKMHAADSMWINDDNLSGYIKKEYVDFVKENFASEVTNLTFNDDAVAKMNAWVKDNTDNMIERVIDQLNADSALVLINAIAFDGKWAEQYEDYQVAEGVFKTAKGEEKKVQMLNGSEDYYLENDAATGFIKYYEGGQYAFVVMLPKDANQSADKMLADFTGDDFDAFMKSSTSQYRVITKMPEFEYDYGNSIAKALQDLGVTDAFSPSADFSGIATFDDERSLYISDVIHKTHIEVNRNGTRAAAVTAVMLDVAGAYVEEQTKSVICDRPFAYAIVDMTDNTPVFIGTVNEV